MNVTGNLHRINKMIPIKQRIQLYQATVTPHFSYADVVWGGCGQVNATRLQTVQNFAARSILGMKKSDYNRSANKTEVPHPQTSKKSA